MSYRIDTEDDGKRFFVSEDGRFKILMDGQPFEHFTLEQMSALFGDYFEAMNLSVHKIDSVSKKMAYPSNRAARREAMKKKGG